MSDFDRTLNISYLIFLYFYFIDSSLALDSCSRLNWLFVGFDCTLNIYILILIAASNKSHLLIYSYAIYLLYHFCFWSFLCFACNVITFLFAYFFWFALRFFIFMLYVSQLLWQCCLDIMRISGAFLFCEMPFPQSPKVSLKTGKPRKWP